MAKKLDFRSVAGSEMEFQSWVSQCFLVCLSADLILFELLILKEESWQCTSYDFQKAVVYRVQLIIKWNKLNENLWKGKISMAWKTGNALSTINAWKWDSGMMLNELLCNLCESFWIHRKGNHSLHQAKIASQYQLMNLGREEKLSIIPFVVWSKCVYTHG